MKKNSMLLQNSHALLWNDFIPEVQDDLTNRYDVKRSFLASHHFELVHDELQALDQNYRRIVTDLSEESDDWLRVHRELPHHPRDHGRIMALGTVPLAQRRRWLRLQRLQLYLIRESKKYRDLSHVVRQLMEFFDDKQLARIHDYLAKMPKTFRAGDHDRTCYILACLDLELERHGYTILRQQLLNQINQRLDLHVTKMDIQKAKWQVLKLDAQLCKTRLKERMKHGPRRQRMITLNLLGQLVDDNRMIHQQLKVYRLSMRQFKYLVMRVWDVYREQHRRLSGLQWIRSDLESTIAACVDVTLRFLHYSQGSSHPQHVLKWLPEALKSQAPGIYNIRKKIIRILKGKLDITRIGSQKRRLEQNHAELHDANCFQTSSRIPCTLDASSQNVREPLGPTSCCKTRETGVLPNNVQDLQRDWLKSKKSVTTRHHEKKMAKGRRKASASSRRIHVLLETLGFIDIRKKMPSTVGPNSSQFQVSSLDLLSGFQKDVEKARETR